MKLHHVIRYLRHELAPVNPAAVPHLKRAIDELELALAATRDCAVPHLKRNRKVMVLKRG